jgi:cell division GTPase FtsZ
VGVHLDPRASGIALSPSGRPWNSSAFAEVSGPTHDFNEWALQVVKHLTGGTTTPGLICFDLADLVSTLQPPRVLHFSRGTSRDGVVGAARAAVESATWLDQSVRSLTIGVWSGARTTLREIGDAAALVTASTSDANAYLFTPLTDEEAVVSVLGG